MCVMQPKIPSPHRPDSLDATALDHSELDHAVPWKAARLVFYSHAVLRILPELEKAVQLHLVGTIDIAQAAVSRTPTAARKSHFKWSTFRMCCTPRWCMCCTVRWCCHSPQRSIGRQLPTTLTSGCRHSQRYMCCRPKWCCRSQQQSIGLRD